MIFCDVGGLWAHFGGMGPHLEDFRDFCDFGGAPAANPDTLLGTNFAQVGAKFELS